MVQTALDRQPWPLSAALNLAPDPRMNCRSDDCPIRVCHFSLTELRIAEFRSATSDPRQSAIKNQKSLTCLTRLQLDRLISVADALSFVRIWLTQLVHFCGYLTKLLLINTGKGQGSLILLNTTFGCQTFGLGVNFSGQWKLDGM